MAEKHDPLLVVRELADVLVTKESYAYALGYIGGELVDAISMLPKSKREKLLELLVRHTEHHKAR